MFINGRTSWDDKTIPESNFIALSASADAKNAWDEFKFESVQNENSKCMKKVNAKRRINVENNDECVVRANFEALNYIRGIVLHFMYVDLFFYSLNEME